MFVLVLTGLLVCCRVIHSATAVAGDELGLDPAILEEIASLEAIVYTIRRRVPSIGNDVTRQETRQSLVHNIISRAPKQKKTVAIATKAAHYRRSLSDLTGETSGIYQRVAFTASFIGNFTQTLHRYRPVTFFHVYLNTRNGYSLSSGIFVAPVPGVYLFSVSALFQESNQCSLELVHNGGGVAVLRAQSLRNRRDQGQMTALLRLQEEDRVFVRGYQSDGQQLWDDGHTVFTGVMLWALA